MPFVNVKLTPEEVHALAERAMQDRRTVRDQASWLIARALRRSSAQDQRFPEPASTTPARGDGEGDQ
jgi:hypothetical protein